MKDGECFIAGVLTGVLMSLLVGILFTFISIDISHKHGCRCVGGKVSVYEQQQQEYKEVEK